MERKAVSVMALILLLLVGVLTLAFKTELVSAIIPIPEYPAIYVDPPVVKGIMPCNNVTVSVKTDYMGDNIQAWQFTLSFNACILHGVNVTNGDIICEGWGPLAKFIPGTFNNTEGTLSLTGAFYFYLGGPIPSPWWGETLANVTFHVVGYGFSNITLGPETKLFGWEPEPPYTQYEIINAETMPDHIGHGYFSNILLGDADFNGLVEMPDFYIWRESFGEGEDRPFSIPDVDPDFNDDGIVDMYDFYIWREHFGESV